VKSVDDGFCNIFEVAITTSLCEMYIFDCSGEKVVVPSQSHQRLLTLKIYQALINAIDRFLMSCDREGPRRKP
jgi:hypothetical protein